MALALPAGTQNLVNHGNALLAEYNQQGLAIHQIAFKQKAVGAKIEEMVAKFNTHEVMSNPKDTIAVLQEVKSSFEMIKTNINTLETKEKEMSNLIQNIIVRQQQGSAESANINAQVVNTQNALNAIQDQINVTQANLNTMAAELQQLQRNIEDAERRVQKKRKRRKWWVIATVLTLGVAGIGAVGAFKSVEAAKNERGHRQQIRANAEANFKNLQASFQQNMAQKANLENDQRQRQFELGQIAEILNRLQPSLQDTSKYRQYLLKLSDAFTQVNSYVQNLEKNLGTVEQVQAAGHSPDGSMNITISTDYKNLGNAWTSAKEQPVVQMALNLQDPNNPGATLGAIKALNLAGRKKRSLEQDKEIFSWAQLLATMATMPLDTVIASMATPTINTSFLTSAPQAILVIQSLSILAACTTDLSLENSKTTGMIKLLKTPCFLRASLNQLSRGMSETFRTADQTMVQIKINGNEIPVYMASVVGAYAKPEDPGSNFINNFGMKNIHKITKICAEEATKAHQTFDDILPLVQELIQVTMATAGGDSGEKVREARNLLDAYEKEKAVWEEQSKKLRAEIAQQKTVIQNASAKTTSKMNGSWNLMIKAVKDVLKMLVGTFSSNSSWNTIPSEDSAAVARIAAKLASANDEQLILEEIANYFPREIKILGQIRQQWIVLEDFFGSLESVIFGPIIEHLAKFDAMVKKEGLQNVTHLRNELVSIVLEVAAVLTNVASGANIYNDVSVKYVMPQIDNAVGKMNIPKAEAKKELLGMESKMQETTKEVHDFIEQKLVEMRKATEEQMAAMRDSLQKAINGTH